MTYIDYKKHIGGKIYLMEQRKLIKFGNSSYVISIPNKWIKKNNLEKGTAVFLKENGENQIIVSPTIIEKKREIKRVTINVTGKSPDELQRETIAAYIRDYSIIKFTGKDLKEKEEAIREIINNLMGLEVIEQTGEWITAKDFLDLEDSSIINLVKRLDICVKSMFEDVSTIKTNQDYQSIMSRKREVNKLWFLVSRATRYYLINGAQKNLDMTMLEIFNLWDAIQIIKKISSELEHQSKNIMEIQNEKEIVEKIAKIQRALYDNYSDMIKSYYIKDKNLAFKVSKERIMLVERCNELYKEKGTPGKLGPLVESLKTTAGLIQNLGRVVHSYGND